VAKRANPNAGARCSDLMAHGRLPLFRGRATPGCVPQKKRCAVTDGMLSTLTSEVGGCRCRWHRRSQPLGPLQSCVQPCSWRPLFGSRSRRTDRSHSRATGAIILADRSAEPNFAARQPRWQCIGVLAPLSPTSATVSVQDTPPKHRRSERARRVPAQARALNALGEATRGVRIRHWPCCLLIWGLLLR